MILGQWDQTGSYDTATVVGTAMPPSALPETSPDYMTGLTDIIGAITQYQLQSKALDINLARAQQGLPPLDVSSYSPGVNVGITPQTQNFATFALLGLGALAVFALAKRR